MTETIEQPSVTEAPTPPAPANDGLVALRSHNEKLIGEKRKVQAQLEELSSQLAAIKAEKDQQTQQQLKDSGEFRTLWEQATATNAALQERITELEGQLTSQSTEMQQQLQRTQFLAKAAGSVLAPDQLYRLVENDLRIKDGKLTALRDGIEVSFDQYLSLLKAPGSGYEHYFPATSTVGMGSVGSAPTPVGGTNPYATNNLTAIIAMEIENPELAAQLKAEANRAR